ncbi:hypothetical protein DIPPA_33211 [Diplonema papillatum]|nr:hypothetical protein DIPPA_33211 [Diplonema papillatum]
MRRLQTRLLLCAKPVSDSVAAQDAVEFHSEWVKKALKKIINDVDPQLQAEVDGLNKGHETPPVSVAGDYVSDGIAKSENFHKEWMEAVHRRVTTDVNPILAQQVSEMKDETVPYLLYPARELGTKVPLPSATSSLPPAVHMWYPPSKKGKPASTITWRLGMMSQRHARSTHADRSATMDHLTFSHVPKGKAPWKLPAHYKTLPIPFMHISGASTLSTLNCCSPFGLRLML